MLKLINLNDGNFCISNIKDEKEHIYKLYRPKNSPLKSVPSTSLPLVGLMMNQNIVSKLPDVVKVEPTENETYTEAKLRTVIAYVSDTNPILILKEIMESCVDSGRADHTSSNILSYLESFCPDFYEAANILSFLGLNRGLPTVTSPQKDRNHYDKQIESPSVFFEKAATLIKGRGHEDKPLDVFYRWPKALVDMYRFGYLEKFYIAPLYDKLGITLNFTNEYLVELPNCFGPSRVIRVIIYSLIAGVDEAKGAPFKLVGLKPNVRELCYEGLFRYKMHSIQVEPMYLPPNCSVDDFIYTVLGIDDVPDIPEWSVALVISALIWHQQKSDHMNCNITDCPVILSTFLLTLIAYHTPESDYPALANHLDEVKNEVRLVLEENNILPSPSVEKEFLHGALEFVNIYNDYVTLSRLLTVLQNPNDSPNFKSPIYNRFPEIHIVIPSLELLVMIACHLKTQESPNAVAMRMWLVKAFCPAVGDISAIKRLQKVVATFSSLMTCISTMRLKFKPLNVEVSDPPVMFIPKEERSSLKPLKPRGNFGSKTSAPSTSAAKSKNFKTQNDQKFKSTSRRNNPRMQGSYAERLTKRIEDLNLKPV